MLPPVLQRFHGASGGAARGVLRVASGRGNLAGWLANRLGLPPAGEGVACRVEVEVEGECERWVRRFGEACLATLQWESGGLLVEAAGPLRIGFRLAADPVGIRFEPVRAWLYLVPLPCWLRPSVTASATARPDGWWLEVSVVLPLLGLLVHYEGEVIPP